MPKKWQWNFQIAIFLLKSESLHTGHGHRRDEQLDMACLRTECAKHADGHAWKWSVKALPVHRYSAAHPLMASAHADGRLSRQRQT